MLIVNADDFGRSAEETNVTLACYAAGRITSATAMVFMKDSARAATRAQEAGMDIGLHLNLSQAFTGEVGGRLTREYHDRVVRYLTSSKYALLLYNPSLRRQFQYVYQAQFDEFTRLYGCPPSHVDGHQHKHLCTNMLMDRIIPRQQKVRRNHSFFAGEKNALNRSYRRAVDWALARRYRLTDFFFSLEQCLHGHRLSRVFTLAASASVELMTHPIQAKEYACLMSDEYLAGLQSVEAGTYSSM